MTFLTTPTVAQQLPNSYPTRRKKKEDKKTEDEDGATAVAHYHRKLILEYGDYTTTGIKLDKSWSKKANIWAKTYRALIVDPGISPDDQCSLLEWAFACQRTWGDDGCTWARVLSGANPPAAWEKHCLSIRRQANGARRPRAEEQIKWL